MILVRCDMRMRACQLDNTILISAVYQCLLVYWISYLQGMKSEKLSLSYRKPLKIEINTGVLSTISPYQENANLFHQSPQRIPNKANKTAVTEKITIN